MSPLQRALGAAAILLCGAIVGGLWRRRLHRLCYSFPSYLGAVALAELLILAWPDRFYRWAFWVAKESVFTILKFAIALELASLAFAAFPGARARARQLALAILGATLAAVLAGPHGTWTDISAIALDLQPHVTNGTALLLASVWAAVFWYHIPLHRVHRAILRGLVPYLVVFTGTARLLGDQGLGLREIAAAADGAAYVVMLAYWTWEAWRRAPEDEHAPAILHRLQPWRARL